MHFSKLFRVKEGKVDTLKQWFAVLSKERKEEAISTFKYENVEREVFVLFKGDEGEYYVIGLNEHSGLRKTGDPTVKINQEHTRILDECLEKISDNGQVLLDLSA